MGTEFDFQSSIKDIQNRLIATSIRNASNLELLKSEEAIKEVIKSYTERFSAVEGMLTDISRYVVESQEIIKVDDFNALFESIYIDLEALYNDLNLVDNVLSLNLYRNKNYFLVLKKRMRELWNRLHATRLQIYDSSPSDESYYESFYATVNADLLSNIEVDKKNGFLYLSTRKKRYLNNSFHIKSINSVTYPVENEEGGVLNTTNILNTLSGNYQDGTRDMLKDGLWKEEVLCRSVPNMIVNIGSSSNPRYRSYRGIVSIIDIEYTYPIELNRMDIDFFGDKLTTLDALMYKLTADEDWSFARLENNDSTEVIPVEEAQDPVAGSAFDIITFMNITKIKAKYLRLVFYQSSYEFIKTSASPELSADQQIEKDLSERRYELVKFGQNINMRLSVPANGENKGIYNQIMSVIESTRDLNKVLVDINKILVPDLSIATYDSARSIKFELGAWSIEPQYEEYTQSKGIYNSKPYPIYDQVLTAVSIDVEQIVPGPTTCNWYISVNNKNLPVMENKSNVRKEPFNIINMGLYRDYADWPGIFILLDFPVDPTYTEAIGVYEDGVYSTIEECRVGFLNSRILYFPDITRASKSEWVIRYPVAINNCITQYVLSPKESESINNDLILGVTCSRFDVLQSFINYSYYRFGSTGPWQKLSKTFTISSAQATFTEAQLWYGFNFPRCLFIASEVSDYLYFPPSTSVANGIFEIISKTGISKLSITSAGASLFRNGTIDSSSDLGLNAIFPNVAPLSSQRIL